MGLPGVQACGAYSLGSLTMLELCAPSTTLPRGIGPRASPNFEIDVFHELTPTMKLRRKPIAEKYEALIERLYAG
jgi:hypothetical protein